MVDPLLSARICQCEGGVDCHCPTAKKPGSGARSLPEKSAVEVAAVQGGPWRMTASAELVSFRLSTGLSEPATLAVMEVRACPQYLRLNFKSDLTNMFVV